MYWNFSSIAEDRVIPGASQKTRLNDSEFNSFSLDCKYKLSDPVADVFGSALYVQGTLDKSQAGGVHEKALLAKWNGVGKGNPPFVIGTSRDHAISHLKLLVVDFRSSTFEA